MEYRPETKRLVLGSAISLAGAAAGGGGGMKVEVGTVEKSRRRPRGAANAALIVVAAMIWGLRDFS